MKEHTVTIEMLGINLTKNELLGKIVVPKSVPVEELGGWGKATKVWLTLRSGPLLILEM